MEETIQPFFPAAPSPYTPPHPYAPPIPGCFSSALTLVPHPGATSAWLLLLTALGLEPLQQSKLQGEHRVEGAGAAKGTGGVGRGKEWRTGKEGKGQGGVRGSGPLPSTVLLSLPQFGRGSGMQGG